jgi:hypothetical protein
MSKQIINDQDITSKLVGKEVVVTSKNGYATGTEGEWAKTQGIVKEVKPEEYIILEIPGIQIRMKIPFAGVSEAIYSMHDKKVFVVYLNEAVKKKYTWGFVEDSPMMPIETRQNLAKQGKYNL